MSFEVSGRFSKLARGCGILGDLGDGRKKQTPLLAGHLWKMSSCTELWFRDKFVIYVLLTPRGSLSVSWWRLAAATQSGHSSNGRGLTARSWAAAKRRAGQLAVGVVEVGVHGRCGTRSTAGFNWGSSTVSQRATWLIRQCLKCVFPISVLLWIVRNAVCEINQ